MITRYLRLALFAFCSAAPAVAEFPTGTVVTASIHSRHLENTMGENPTRAVSVYLPPDYKTSQTHALADRGSRGITGHSMGGYGALLLAMKHPDVFSTVYALSPGALAIVREYGPNSDTYRSLASVTSMEELAQTYFGKVVIAFGRSWSPNTD